MKQLESIKILYSLFPSLPFRVRGNENVLIIKHLGQ